MKNIVRLRKYLFLLFLGALVGGCKGDRIEWHVLDGKTMGTTYHIQYLGGENYQPDIDRLLKEINDAVSTYLPTSTISEFN